MTRFSSNGDNKNAREIVAHKLGESENRIGDRKKCAKGGDDKNVCGIVANKLGESDLYYSRIGDWKSVAKGLTMIKRAR